MPRNCGNFNLYMTSIRSVKFFFSVGDGKEVTKDSSNKDEEKKKQRKGDTPIIKYMKTQVKLVTISYS